MLRNITRREALEISLKFRYYLAFTCGSSSVGRALAFQAKCREFDPRLPLQTPQQICYNIAYV